MTKIINLNLFYFILLILSFTTLYAGYGLSNKVPIRFDAGSHNSEVYKNHVLLEVNEIFSSEKGFGWIIPPITSYSRNDLITSSLRNELTLDGVVGKELEFKTEIAKGEWWFTFWMEAGNDYTNTAKLFLNDKEMIISSTQLYVGEGGENAVMPVYRVFQTKVNITGDSFTFRLVGGKDSIKLSGFSLIPSVQQLTEEQQTINSLVKEGGKYKSRISLPDLSDHLNKLVDENPNDSFLSFCLQQINLLKEGEKIANMMGWEWAKETTRLSLFDRLKQAVTIFDGLIENKDSNENILFEKSLWLRGKILYDLFLESGGSSREASGKGDLKKLYEIYPEDPNLQMINGVKVDLPDPCDEMSFSENAPKWSKLQRELYNRLSNEIDWWVNERQASNGELGGKLGDDVELLRWWSSFLLTGNQTAIRGWKKLADAVWNSPNVYKGYSKRVYDVEHASEFISDSTPELMLIDDDSTYYQRLEFTADHFEKLWTTVNKNGHRLFKSAWYSSTEVDETPPRNIDVDYNSRAVKPLRYLAWATRNERFIKLLDEWSRAWIDAAMSTSKNKPKGILPSAIRAYDESFNGDGSNWYQANTFWNYFDWHHSVGSKILDNIMFTYILTNDSYLLQPIEYSIKMIDQWLKKNLDIQENDYEDGSVGWVVKNMIKNNEFWNVIEKWRFLTNNNSYDSLLKEYGNDYSKYKLTGNIEFLENNLERTLEEIRYNTPLRTSLVVHTDRVRTPGANTLKAMLTGDGTNEASSPYYAITWENTNRDFTALVDNFDSKTLSVKIFSHSKADYNIGARLWLLDKGEYKLTLTNSKSKIILNNKITITKAGDRINFTLPAEELVNLKVEAN